MKVFLAGASGQLGSRIAETLTERDHIFAPLHRPNAAGSYPELDLHFETLRKLGSHENFASLLIVDVSLAAGTKDLCRYLLAQADEEMSHLRAFVIATTGHDAETLKMFERLAKRIPLVISSNFSRGVFLLEEILTARTHSGLTVAALAQSLGFELGLIESHHSKKIDAPSGTAVTLAKAAGIETQKIASLRLGHIIGEHTIVASGDSEELRFTHTAQNRKLFALGAVDLLNRIKKIKLPPGNYTMREILQLPQST